MAKLTPEELKEARRLKAEERRTEEAEQMRRQEESARRQAEVRERRGQLAALRHRLNDHESLVAGLYDELDKLAKKAPHMPSTSYIVTSTNRSIQAVKEFVGGPCRELLGEDDDFLAAVEQFVPAGDPPEHRDVLITLRELRGALARTDTRLQRADKLLAEDDDNEPKTDHDRLLASMNKPWR